jgi:HAD superfamily hydrolase (TIGR01509 family)
MKHVAQDDIRCLIFDSDGTLVDTLDLIVAAYNYAVEPVFGKTFSEAQVSALFGPPMRRILANVLRPSAVNDAVNRYHAFYRQHFHDHVRVYPGILEVLTAIQKSGRKLGVLTGAGRVAAEVTLQYAQLSEFFQTLVTGDDVTHPKPDPQGLRMAISQIGEIPEKTVYVGDNVVDLEAAKRAGARSAAALWGSRHRDELTMWRPNYILREPSQITQTMLG